VFFGCSRKLALYIHAAIAIAFSSNLFSLRPYIPFKKSCANAHINPMTDGKNMLKSFIKSKPVTVQSEQFMVLAMVNGRGMDAADFPPREIELWESYFCDKAGTED
jgi:hypothetical protein